MELRYEFAVAIVIFAAAIFLFAFLLGWFFGSRRRKKSFDGTLIIGKNEDRDFYRWIFDKELEDFKKDKELWISVQVQDT